MIYVVRFDKINGDASEVTRQPVRQMELRHLMDNNGFAL